LPLTGRILEVDSDGHWPRVVDRIDPSITTRDGDPLRRDQGIDELFPRAIA
jgi:hypothetical protein